MIREAQSKISGTEGHLRVFVSYSRSDARLKEQLMEHLGVFERFDGLSIWTDEQIAPGVNWREEIERAMLVTDVALLLVSASFLASSFINDKQLPDLLERQASNGLVVIPIILKACNWESHPAIEPFQVLPKGGNPIAKFTGDKRHQALKEVASSVAMLAKKRAEYRSPKSSASSSGASTSRESMMPGSEKPGNRAHRNAPHTQPISLERSRRVPFYLHPLHCEPDFVGREQELVELEELHRRPQSLVVAIVSIGGTGKSALMQEFVKRLERDKQPPSGAFFVWSFFVDQNTDQFLKEAYYYLTGTTSSATASLGHVYALAEVLRRTERAVLVLDGLERMQEDVGQPLGRVRDSALRLLLELIAQGCGRAFAIVTSRLPLTDLQVYQRQGGYHELSLPQLTSETAIGLLEARGARGRRNVLRVLVERFGCHALTVSLLGSAISDFFDGDAERATESLDLARIDLLDQSGKLTRMLNEYEQWLGPEAVILLERMSAFIGKIRLGLLEAVCLGQGKERVSGPLAKWTHLEFRAMLARLEKLRLVERASSLQSASCSPEPFFTLHAVIKDHFYHRLLRCGSAPVHAAIRECLSSVPMSTHPKTEDELGLIEELIHHTRMVGQIEEAFNMYFSHLGSYEYLGEALGEYTRGVRIVRGFFVDGDPLKPHANVPHYNATEDLGLFLAKLGDLHTAATCHQAAATERTALRNLFKVRLLQGKLHDAIRIITEPSHRLFLKYHEDSGGAGLDVNWPVDPYWAAAAALLGRLHSARIIFARCFGEYGFINRTRGLDTVYYADFLLRTGNIDESQRISERALVAYERREVYDGAARFRLLLADASRLRGKQDEARLHIEAVHQFAERTGWQEALAAAHLAAGRNQLKSDPNACFAAADKGLVIADRCGFGLLHIDLLVLRAEAQLSRGDNDKAEETARQALRLASDESCGYAWGRADAMHVLGQILKISRRSAEARAMLALALAARNDLGDPGAAATKHALATL